MRVAVLLGAGLLISTCRHAVGWRRRFGRPISSPGSARRHRGDPGRCCGGRGWCCAAVVGGDLCLYVLKIASCTSIPPSSPHHGEFDAEISRIAGTERTAPFSDERRRHVLPPTCAAAVRCRRVLPPASAVVAFLRRAPPSPYFESRPPPPSVKTPIFHCGDRMFRCAMKIQSIASNQSWWFRACDQCSCGAIEDGDAFRCSGNACTCRSASPRYKLAVRAEDGDAVVNMIFFGDVATDLIGRPTDELLNEFLSSNEVLPSDIARLVRRSYVVDVIVSRLSIHRPTIDFQVVKFCTEGGSEYMDFVSANIGSAAVQPPQVSISGENSAIAAATHASPVDATAPAKESLLSGTVATVPPAEPQMSSGVSGSPNVAIVGGAVSTGEVLPQTPPSQLHVAESSAVHKIQD